MLPNEITYQTESVLNGMAWTIRIMEYDPNVKKYVKDLPLIDESSNVWICYRETDAWDQIHKMEMAVEDLGNVLH